MREGKMSFKIKSRMKWAVLVGLVLSTFSILTHFFLARYTYGGITEYQSSITVFSWRSVYENADFSTHHPRYKRLWGPVRLLESLLPYANPRGNYAGPKQESTGFIFVRIRGGFHEIRNSISDIVVVARLLNATLVIPEVQSTTSSKGISAQFKSFAYLYNEEQFIAALANDVRVVKTLPKHLKGARRKKEIPSFKVSYLSSTYFYIHQVLPVLSWHSVVELVVSDGGCLQAKLPPHLEELQRLRCRVSFHALKFRDEVEELATKILNRLRTSGRPFIAYEPGMTRDALAFYGCAELFQDVHTELIQHRRSWMIKRGIVKGNLSADSAEQRRVGLCPLMPEEVGILLRAYGYSRDTIIYVSGGEVFGGQKKLIPLRAMFENVVDRTSLSTPWELNRIYGRETVLNDKQPKTPPMKERKFEEWKTSGPRPWPLPPPPARPKYYNIEGWWGWVAESDIEPESTVMELRTNAHKLLWEAVDYRVCTEADAFIPGFDRDGKGHPNFASLVMGHRLYQFAASKTFRLDREVVNKLLDEIQESMYQANRTWVVSIRRHLRKHMIDGLADEFRGSKQLSFLSFPTPECSCMKHNSTEKSSLEISPSSPHSRALAFLETAENCPAWMDDNGIPQSKDKESEELEDDDSSSSGFFFEDVGANQEGEGGEMNSKEDTQMEDSEELEGGER